RGPALSRRERPRRRHDPERRTRSAIRDDWRSLGGLKMSFPDINTPVLLGQLLLGLINGSFYAILSLGLTIIFGMLNIINFAHGALYMMGAFVAWMLLTYVGLGYWWALGLAPLVVGVFGVVLERV